MKAFVSTGQVCLGKDKTSYGMMKIIISDRVRNQGFSMEDIRPPSGPHSVTWELQISIINGIFQQQLNIFNA